MCCEADLLFAGLLVAVFTVVVLCLLLAYAIDDSLCTPVLSGLGAGRGGRSVRRNLLLLLVILALQSGDVQLAEEGKVRGEWWQTGRVER